MHGRYKMCEQMITKLGLEWIHKKVKTKDKYSASFITLYW